MTRGLVHAGDMEINALAAKIDTLAHLRHGFVVLRMLFKLNGKCDFMAESPCPPSSAEFGQIKQREPIEKFKRADYRRDYRQGQLN